MAAQVKELTKEVEGWKRKYQKVKQKYNAIQRELDDIRKDNQKLSEEKDILQGVSDRYDRVVRVLGIETVDTAGYSKRESPGRKATDGTNAEGKYS